MSWVFQKMPPNSSGVAGFIWQRHGGRHDLNGHGGNGGRLPFFFEIFAMGHVGLTRPNPNPIFACKRGEQRK